MALKLCLPRCKSSQKCVTSKAVLLILIWCFSVSLVFNSYFEGGAYSYVFSTQLLENKELHCLCVYAANAAVLCLYPLAGFLADNRVGRFITIYEATKFLLLLTILTGIIFLIDILIMAVLQVDVSFWIIFINISAAFLTLLFLLTVVTLALFNANIIQFGVDQLQDSPADHQSLYIYWYVWVNFVAVFILLLTGSTITSVPLALPEKAYIFLTVVVAGPLISSIVIFCIILIVVHFKKHWFLIDSANSNPYKLVYRVTTFARQHKVPIRRSAFTYCEDDIPTGLDLGKNRYGGPFTTEQVEDVKAFYGILKILFSLGITFFLDIVSGPLFTMFAHLQYSGIIFFDTTVTIDLVQSILLKKGMLSSTLVVLGVPIYICLIRPYYHCGVNMLKRMGIGIIFFILSVICTFVTEATIHSSSNSTIVQSQDSDWIISDIDLYLGTSHHNRVLALIPQQCLSALSVLFIYPALYEFICAQSPHSMKGLFIGLTFAVKGFFEFLSSATFLLFYLLRHSLSDYITVYYAVTTAVGVVGLILYVYSARRYKLRERDELCNVHRFAEEYYSKIEEEH